MRDIFFTLSLIGLYTQYVRKISKVNVIRYIENHSYETIPSNPLDKRCYDIVIYSRDINIYYMMLKAYLPLETFTYKQIFV